MYGMTVNELKALNNLTSNNLSIGEVLRVVKSQVEDKNTYVVKPGDSLYSIAKRFGINVDSLKSANNKNNNLLSIGEILIIPDNQTGSSSRIHIVEPGDTLYNIARTYNTTVDEIKRLNNLNSNTLTIGRILYV